MHKKMKILYITNIPSPYRVSFFNELGKNTNLTVLFETKYSTSREESWHNYDFENFKGVFLKSIRVSTNQALSLEIFKYIYSDEYDHIIVGGYSTPTGMLSIILLSLLNKKFILNVDGGLINYKENELKRKTKEFFISRATYWLCTGDLAKEYLLHYGAKKENIYEYPFTTTRKDEVLKSYIDAENKKRIKDDLGIKEKFILLSVGQFIHRKGFDILLEAAKKIDKKIGIYIVGGLPTDEYQILKEESGNNNIHFISFKNPTDLKSYYLASDIFVLPTREDIWGLVINEAMANGVPIITTNKCAAGVEMVEDYLNGFIIPINNSDALAEKINYLYDDPALLTSMSKRNLEKAQKFTIENMSKETIENLLKINK